MLAQWLSVLDVYDFEIQHRAGIKHANADGLTQTDCTQCKRDGCDGRGMGLGESRILQVYEDTLDLHKQYFIQDDIALLQLPTPMGNEGLSNWLGCWTATQLRDWQGQDQAVSTARAWKLANKERPTWKAISGEGHELKALWSQWSILEVREGILYRKYIPETGKRLEDDEPQVVISTGGSQEPSQGYNAALA